MSRLHISRPNPALVVATIALIVATGGTSYAALSLPQNSVGSKQLKNAAVTNAKIKKGAVGTKQIADGAVTQAKLNLTRVTVPSAGHASNADQATNADHAANADHALSADTATHVGTADTVGGVNVHHFDVKMPVFGSATLVDTGLITLSASCSGSGIGVSLAKDNGAPAMAAGITATGADSDKVVSAGYRNLIGPVFIDLTADDAWIIHGEVGTTSGTSVTINMLFTPAPNFFPSEDVCLASGTVMSN
jgi:hypothetical protein